MAHADPDAFRTGDLAGFGDLPRHLVTGILPSLAAAAASRPPR